MMQIKGYEGVVVYEAAEQLRRIAAKFGLETSGQIPLPTHIQKWTVLRSPHIHKKSRETFEMRTYKRVVEVRVTEEKANSFLHMIQHFRENLPGIVGMRIRTEEIPSKSGRVGLAQAIDLQPSAASSPEQQPQQPVMQ
jgi:small subunit ribosomal protein S10